MLDFENCVNKIIYNTLVAGEEGSSQEVTNLFFIMTLIDEANDLYLLLKHAVLG